MITTLQSLHVIHHAEMGPLMWLFCRVYPFSHSMFGPAINSFIHTMMYAYYGLTGVGISLPVAWKKAMTSAQVSARMMRVAALTDCLT